MSSGPITTLICVHPDGVQLVQSVFTTHYGWTKRLYELVWGRDLERHLQGVSGTDRERDGEPTMVIQGSVILSVTKEKSPSNCLGLPPSLRVIDRDVVVVVVRVTCFGSEQEVSRTRVLDPYTRYLSSRSEWLPREVDRRSGEM